MRAFLLALLLPALALAQEDALGTEADFAALSIQARGPQTFDLSTGITTLPEGGVIRDRREDVTLEGSFIRYREGDFIEVRGATVRGAFGSVRAPELRFEVGPQTLQARSDVRFESLDFGMRAERLTLDLESDVAVAEGGVRSETPALEGARALVDMRTQQALLVGPYTYQDGPITLRGAPGELLALRWNESGEVSAETEVTPALRERFRAYLP